MNKKNDTQCRSFCLTNIELYIGYFSILTKQTNMPLREIGEEVNTNELIGKWRDILLKGGDISTHVADFLKEASALDMQALRVLLQNQSYKNIKPKIEHVIDAYKFEKYEKITSNRIIQSILSNEISLTQEDVYEAIFERIFNMEDSDINKLTYQKAFSLYNFFKKTGYKNTIN